MNFILKPLAKFAYWICYPILRIIFPLKIVWEDKKETKETLKHSCVVYSNHRGYVEGLYLTRVFNKYKVYTYVGKDWYEKKAINWLFRNLHYISIDRQQMDTSWLDKGTNLVKEGNSIYILPEGHTTKVGDMDEFKPGFLVLAKACDVPLVPIYIVNQFKPFHKTTIVIGKTLRPDLHEEGRPSLILKKYSAECREYLYKLSKLI